MLTKEKLNDEFEKKYGKVVENEQIDKAIDSISKSLNEFYADKKVAVFASDKTEENTVKNINNSLIREIPEIQIFEFSDASNPNAFASKVDEEYMIGILKGTFHILKNLFWYIVESDEFSEMPHLSIVKKDSMINKLNQHCLDFLKFHEFAHIMNGHCDYMKSLGIKELCEDTNITDSEKGTILQTLEYDADCCAISNIINEEIRNYVYAFQSIGINPDAGAFIDSFESFLCALAVSLYTLFQVLASKKEYQNIELTKEKLAGMSHPVPGIRITYIIINIGCILTQWKIFDEKQILRLVDTMLEELKEYIKLNEYVVPSYYIKYSINEPVIDQMQKVHDNWKTAREELMEYTYVRLAEYEEFDYKQLYHADNNK